MSWRASPSSTRHRRARPRPICSTAPAIRAAFGREPDRHTCAVWQAHISAGHSRHHLLEDVLGSAEARERGVRPDTLARFRRRLAAWAPVQLRRAWALPDRAFVHAAYQWTLGRTHDPEYGAAAMRDLENGGSRLDVLARLTESAEARERGMPAGMLEHLRSELRSTTTLSDSTATPSNLAEARCASAS
jgi:hypothetical protein